MQMPPKTRRSDAVHKRAIEQLAEARAARRRLSDRADAARGTPGEERAADERDAARDRVAAKEAWLHWVERGV